MVHRFCFSLEEEGHHGRQPPHYLSPSVNQVPQPCAGCKTLVCVCGEGEGGGGGGITGRENYSRVYQGKPAIAE